MADLKAKPTDKWIVRKFPTTPTTPEMWTVWENERGDIWCNSPLCKQRSSCVHVLQAVEDGADTLPRDHLWNVLVPIFENALYSVFRLMPAAENENLYEVQWLAAKEDTPDKTLVTYQATVGVLSAGEKRRQIRSMFLDWLDSQYALVPACSSPYHNSWRFGFNDRRIKVPTQDDLLNVVSLYATGRCRSCQTADDLIPKL